MTEDAIPSATSSREKGDERDSLSHAVLGAAIAVHRVIGPGMLEVVYETCMAFELEKRGLSCQRGVKVPIVYDGRLLKSHFRIDMLVENELVIELKSVQAVLPVHVAQLLTYLRLSGCRRGLLINFNVTRLMLGVTRVVF